VHIAAGSGSPVGTAVHRPIDPVTAHDRHEPSQAVAQQTPCAQWADWHSAPPEQKAPFGLSPHDPPTQLLPIAHALSFPHAV
jgi:hypothetical protein